MKKNLKESEPTTVGTDKTETTQTSTSQTTPSTTISVPTVTTPISTQGGATFSFTEFAMGSGTVDSIYGSTRNYYDQSGTYIAGGSSGGSAVVVASGSCYA